MIKNPIVLVVDDQAVIRKLIAMILKRQGIHPMLAEDAQAARDMLVIHPVNLILLDIDMPGMNGLEFCRSIKAEPLLAHIPVVFCSGRNTLEDCDQMTEAGGAAYLAKPFNMNALIEIVCAHL